MKLNQFLRRTARVLAAIPLAMALIGASSYAVAQTTVPATTTTADPTRTALTIRISGTLPLGTDSVVFDKQAVEVASFLSRDADPTVPPQLIIDISFLKFTGQALISKLKYISDNQIQLLKPLAATQSLEVMFSAPEAKLDKAGKVRAASTLTAAESTQVLSEAPAFKAIFNLTFDANGALTGATGTIGANTYASAQ